MAAMKLALGLAALAANLLAVSAATPPIIIKGSQMYNSETKARFFVKGLTYEYAVDDAFYTQYGQKAFNDLIEPLGVNAIRLYQINPDKSYEKFMLDMQQRNMYVMVTATPGGDDYFGDYKNCVLNRFLMPLDNGGCYPACLLEYGKKVASMFAKYDNSLALIVGNEVMQFNATSAPCIKQYAKDLKSWMRSAEGVKSMRVLPLAYAEADTAPPTAATTSTPNDWHTLRNQFFACDDPPVEGSLLNSIDITMVNTYRYCSDATGKTSYEKLKAAVQGYPGVNIFGEYDCPEVGPSGTRSWGAVSYLFSPSMTDVFSGGFAYTYGYALLDANSPFPIVSGGGTKATDNPGYQPTAAYTALKQAYNNVQFPAESGTWSSKSAMCTFKGTVPKGTQSFTQTCAEVTKRMSDLTGTKVQWPVQTREGAICNKEGTTCDVAYPTGLKVTQTTLCGGQVPKGTVNNGGTDSGGNNGDGNSSSAPEPSSVSVLAISAILCLCSLVAL